MRVMQGSKKSHFSGSETRGLRAILADDLVLQPQTEILHGVVA
jgi:hypothetical protein